MSTLRMTSLTGAETALPEAALQNLRATVCSALIQHGDADESAFGRRDAPYLLGIEANWEDPRKAEQNVAWARQAYQCMEPYSTGSLYLNLNVLGEGSI